MVGLEPLLLNFKGDFWPLMSSSNEWVSVNSTGKISDGCIRDLGFNPRLHKKTDWCLSLMIKSYY